MTNKIGLALLSTLLLSATACSGGGGGGNNIEPCCGAEGQTNPPPSGGPAFAGGGEEIERRLAQPILLTTSGCISLDTPSLLLLPEYESAGKAVEVAADGSFVVEIDERGEGREVAVRIFDELSDGTEVDRGVSYLAKPPIAVPDATPIPVAPILFEGRAFAEGTVEAALYCELKVNDQIQFMKLADIRAIVTSGYSAAFVAGGNLGSMMEAMSHYRHGLNGIVDPARNGGFAITAQIDQMRLDYDEEVDACALGRSPHPACQSRGPEAYRYWLYANDENLAFEGTADEGRTLRNHLFVGVKDMGDSLEGTSGVDALDPHRMAMLRNQYLLRYELFNRAILKGVACYGDVTCSGAGPVDLTTDTGNGSIQSILDDLHTAIVTGPTPNDLTSAFSNANFDISGSFSTQAGIAADNANNTAVNNAFAAQAVIQPTFTHAQIAAAIFGSGGQYATTATQIQQDAAFSALSPDDLAALTELMFNSGSAVVPLVTDNTAGGGF